MRRLLVILLAFSFSFPLLLPVIAGATESELPACCRRDGKHQCGMAARKASGGEATFTKGACAQFPAGKSTVAERDNLILADAGGGETFAVAQAVAGAVQNSALAQFQRRESERGPPVRL